MADKKKVLLVISHDLFVRNYIQTNIIEDLQSDFQFLIIASENITNKSAMERGTGFAGYFSSKSAIDKLHQSIFDLLMWRYRKRSSSFYFRFLRYLKADLLLNTTKGLFGKTRSILKFIISNLKDTRAIKIILLGNRFIFPISINWLKNKATLNADLENRIKSIQPDLIIFPSSAYDSVGNDIIRIAKSINCKSLFLIDNWDNLSSKSLFWIKPDYLGVWGEQSKQHAIQVHRFSDQAITKIGTPRFDKYYSARNQNLKSHFDFQYVLFVGCAIPFDEVSALKILEKEIEDNLKLYKNVKILYRPHPWRQSRIKEEIFSEEKFKHVVIDPQIKNAYYDISGTNPSGIGFQPDVTYYPALLKNALFVIGPLTTMLIEALIFYRKIIALAYNDQIHFTSPHNALKYFVHFEGIENISAMSFCKQFEHLPINFRDTFTSGSEINKKEVDDQLHYYLYSDELSYSNRLKNLIHKI